jgi:hypothetical protein
MEDLEFYKSDDMSVWAKEFIKIVKENSIIIDEEYIDMWLHNAFMRGRDYEYWKSKKYKKQVRRALVSWWKRIFVPLDNFGR